MSTALIYILAALACALVIGGFLVAFLPGKEGRRKGPVKDVSIVAGTPVDGVSLVKIQKADRVPLYRIKSGDGQVVAFVPGEVDEFDEGVMSNIYLVNRLDDESIPVEERIALKRKLQARGYKVFKDFGDAEKEYGDGLVPESEAEGVEAQPMPGSPSVDDGVVDVEDEGGDGLESASVVPYNKKKDIMTKVYDAMVEKSILPSLAAAFEKVLGFNLLPEAWKGVDREKAIAEMKVLELDTKIAERGLDNVDAILSSHIRDGVAAGAEQVRDSVSKELADIDGAREENGSGAPPDPLDGMGL